MRALVLLAICLSGVALAASLEGRHALLLETEPPAGWKVVGVPPRTMKISFFIALRQQNLEQLAQLAQDVSDPLNVKYGQYLNREQILAIVAPPKETGERVMAALGLLSCVHMGDALKCNAPVEAVEQAFQTQLRFVRHESSHLSLVRQIGNFSVPASIAADVEVSKEFAGMRVLRIG